MSHHHPHGPKPDRGPAPAYRLAPDTPAEIAADLALLVAPREQDVPAVGIPVSAEPARVHGGHGLLRCHDDAVQSDARTESTAPARAEDIAPFALRNSGLSVDSAAEGIALARVAIAPELAPAEPARLCHTNGLLRGRDDHGDALRRGRHNHDGAAILADMARAIDGGAQ